MRRALFASVTGAGRGQVSSRVLLWAGGLALSLMVSLSVYVIAAKAVDDDAQVRFDHLTRSAQYSMTARLRSYTGVVRGLVALYRTSETPITRAQFRDYVDALDLPEHFPAIDVLSFAQHVPQAQREAFVRSVRADRSIGLAGYPDFSISPPGQRASYTVLTYVEPGTRLADRLGYDIASVPAIAAALDLSRDTGHLGAAGLPILFDRPTQQTVLGMRLPVYRRDAQLVDVASRRAAYVGSVGVAFSVARLAQSTLDEMVLHTVHLSVYADAGADPEQRQLAIDKQDRLLFNDAGPDEDPPLAPSDAAQTVEAVLPIDYNGSLWKARFRVLRSDLYTDFDAHFPPIAMATGFAGTMLLYALFSMLYASRRSAIEQRVLLDTVLNNVEAHVYMKDQHRRYIYANSKTAEAMGLSVEQIVGRLDRDVLPPALADAYWAQDKQVFESGQRQSAEADYTDAAGVGRHLWTVKVPVLVDTRITAMIGLSTDVTELHKLRAEADAANRAKSNFLSNMSHEIRTPMNSIIGMAHLALKSVANPKQRDYLEKIYHSGQHLMGIINDILDFSKIEAGKMELEVLDFALDTLLADVANQLNDSAEQKGLSLKFEIAPGLSHRLRGDPLRLEQVLLNFTSNAIKFSDNGQVLVRAAPVDDTEAETVVRFEVKDRGIGLDEAQVAALFQSFHQADPSTTRKYGGTGLGLVISKQLAELMGGTVGVDTAPGHGSVFWFTARLGKSAQAISPEPEMVAPGLLGEIAGASVLLVEDNTFSQQVGQELLEDAGATVVIANNGKEAIDLLLKERFDCVLMDVQMPLMDGFEATRLIRAHPDLRETLVIAMTANAGTDDQRRCLEAGMDEFVTKPIAPHLLLTVVARALAARVPRSARRPAAVATAAVPAMLASADPDLLDLNVLAQTFGHNAAKMRKYVLLFLDSAGDGVAEVEAAIAQQDLERVCELGHRIKSSARAVGAGSFAALCLRLEGLRDGGNLADARALCEQMQTLRARLIAHVEREMTSSAFV